jgi:5-methylcytosine-specific restriction endonuclease McrA
VAWHAITPSVRFEVFRRDSFTCQYCGRRAPNVILHVDHIIPVVAGGTNDLANLRTACSVCNQGKGARRLVGC